MFPILRTKITIPPVSPRQIQRARLLRQVSQGAQRALTLIVAPAGYGKTTLAAAWAQTGEMPSAWLTLQPGDRPRERFVASLIQALRVVFPPVGQTTLALLQGGFSEGALAALINDLCEVRSHLALVLDDYHCVDGPETREVVQYLLENRPANFHLILTTRVMPDLNLTRLRGLDQVVQVGVDDLRFTRQEVLDFLKTRMELLLPPDEVQRLERLTEGWAVGLQLAALALARHSSGWQQLDGQERVFDYLAEEVLRRETPEVQEFMQITALFDRFCAPLAEVLLRETGSLAEPPGMEAGAGQKGRPGSTLPPKKTASGLLRYVERANLFLVSLDPRRTWYRYHALFTDFLRRAIPEDRAAAYYRAASRWFEQAGYLDDAVHYAVHARDWQRAAELLECHYQDMLQRGEQSAILEWIAALPIELLDRYPRLWLARGWAQIISLDSQEAYQCIERAQQIGLSAQENESLLGEAKALRILTEIFSGKVTDEQELSEAFVLLSEKDDFLHSLLHFNMGLRSVILGETAQAVDAFNETIRLTKVLNNPLVTIVAYVQLGETRQVRGAFGLAERTFQQAFRYARDTLGENTFLLGMPYISYADLLREQNRFDDALEFAEKGIAYCQLWQPVASMDGLIAVARIRAAQGRWEESDEYLERALHVSESSVSLVDDRLVATQRARLALLRGDAVRAVQALRSIEWERVGDQNYYIYWEVSRLLQCRLKILEYAQDGAELSGVIEELAELARESERRERLTPLIESLILQAYAFDALGQPGQASETLTRALTLGAQSGYARMFADEGAPLLRLLEKYSMRIHAPRSYADRITHLLRQEMSADQPIEHANRQQAGQLIPLTRRELDILSLLALGKSNQEIANEFVLTVNTVKKHVSNILGKMGVSNRTQAVMLARERGWLE